MTPSETGESGEITVTCDPLTIIFDSQCGMPCIRNKLSFDTLPDAQ